MATGLATEDAKLAHVVLDRGNSVVAVAGGRFTSASAPGEIVVATTQELRLVQVGQAGAYSTVATQPLYAVVRCVVAVPAPPDSNLSDALAVTTDSGRLVLLRFDVASHTWLREAFDTFGKSGVRRSVPGQYLAVDPLGRSVMVAAVERSKFVYSISLAAESTDDEPGGPGLDDGVDDEQGGEDDLGVWREAATKDRKLKLSSALEAHKHESFVFGLVAFTTAGREQSLYATIEHSRDTMVPGEKAVVVYEHDRGLNHVLKLWTHPAAPSASMISAFPPCEGYPTGALIVSSDDTVTALTRDGQRIRKAEVTLPRRTDFTFPEGATVPIAATSLIAKGGWCYFVLQNDLGDLFRVQLSPMGSDALHDRLTVRYLDTVPVASQMYFFKHGYLFVAADSDDHAIFQVTSDGPKDDGYIVGSSRYRVEQTGATVEVPMFERREHTQNVNRVATMRNLAPLTAAVPLPRSQRRSISDSVMLLGRGASSAVGLCTYGHSAIPTVQLAVELDSSFTQVFSVPAPVPRIGEEPSLADERHTMLVLSSHNCTRVFATHDGGSQAVVESYRSGLELNIPTVAVAELAAGAGTLQVHRHGFRHVAPAAALDWRHGFDKQIAAAAATAHSCLVAFQHGGLYFFVLDTATGKLAVEYAADEVPEAAAVAIAPPPPGSARPRLAGIVRPQEFVTVMLQGEQALTRVIKRLKAPRDVSLTNAAFVTAADNQLYAYVGLSNGTMIRLTVDAASGEMVGMDETTCGVGPVRIMPPPSSQTAQHVLVTCGGSLLRAAVLDGAQHVAPVRVTDSAVGTAFAACDFATGKLAPGHAAILAPNLLSFSRIDTSSTSHVHRVPMKLTGRRVACHPSEPWAVVLMNEHRALSGARPPLMPRFAAPSGYEGLYAWSMAVVDCATAAVRCDLDPVRDGIHAPRQSEAALSLTVFTPFDRQFPVVAVGVAPNFFHRTSAFDPKNLPMIRCFSFTEGGLKPEHATTVDGLPATLAAMPAAGLLVAGVGRSLRVLSMGTTQLLQKSALRDIVQTAIVSVACQDSMIAVGDAHASVTFVKYYAGVNRKRRDSNVASYVGPVMVAVASHYVPRHIVSLVLVDTYTCALSDRFGNVAVVRVPDAATTTADVLALELQSGESEADVGRAADSAAAAATKAVEVANFFVGATVASLYCAPLGASAAADQGAVDVASTTTSSGPSALVYHTVTGAVGAFVPLAPEDFRHVQFIESFVREEAIPVAGREHRAYRSTYGPLRGVVDVDFAHFHVDTFTAEQRAALDAFVREKALEGAVRKATAEGIELSAEALQDAKVPSASDALASIRNILR